MTRPDDRSEEILALSARTARDPRSHTFARLAELFLQSGELGRALEVVEAGLRHHPHYLNARIVHARVLRELGRVDEAQLAFERVLKIDSENESARRGLDALAAGDETDEAVTPPGAHESRVRDAAGWLERLDAEFKNGSGSQAPPDDMETATLAALYVQQGLIDEAVGIYERLLARDPYNARLATSLEEARSGSRTGKKPAHAETARTARPASPPPAETAGPALPPPAETARPFSPTPESSATSEDAANGPSDEQDGLRIGEYLEALLEGKAPVQGSDRRVQWPDWLTLLGGSP